MSKFTLDESPEHADCGPSLRAQGRRGGRRKPSRRQIPADQELELLKAPRTDNQLWRDLRDNFGVPFPRRPVCEGHSCPFEFISDVYFEKHPDDCLVYANRKGYKSLSAAALISYMMRDSRAGDPMRILNLGGNEEQAKQVLGYASGFWMKWPRAAEYVAPAGILNYGLKLRKGDWAKIVAASLRNVHGPAVHLLMVDEIDCFDEKERGTGRGQALAEVQEVGDLRLNPILLGSMSVTCSGAGRAGRWVGMSTFHNPAGTMSKLVDFRELLGLRLYNWCFLDTTERCRETWDCRAAAKTLIRDLTLMRKDKELRFSPEHAKAKAHLRKLEQRCNLIEFCQGALKEADGLFKIVDVRKARRRLGPEAFAFYWACKRPRVKAAVLDTQDVEAALVDGLEYEPSLPAYMTIDPGWEETAAQLWQTETIMRGDYEFEVKKLVDAWTWRQTPPTEKLNSLEATYMAMACGEITSDGAAREFNESMVERGMNVVAVPFSVNKEPTIDVIKADFATGCVLINSRLTEVVKQLKGWRRTATGAIIKRNDHHCDAMVAFYANRKAGAGAGLGEAASGKKIATRQHIFLDMTARKLPSVLDEPPLPEGYGGDANKALMERAKLGPLGRLPKPGDPW